MAAALLVGTNAWADVHATLVDGVDEAKVKIKDGDWQYATKLKDAFDYVEMNDTAEIVLLNNVTLTRQSGNEDYGITLPSTIEKADLSGANAKAGPNITLDMNGKLSYNLKKFCRIVISQIPSSGNRQKECG